MKGVVSLFLLISGMLGASTLAEDYQLKDEIAAYNQNDYREVIGMGHLLAVQDPENALVHYYLANSYYRLGLTKDARREYLLCLKLTDDLQTRAYCEQALLSLRAQSIADSSSANTNSRTSAFFQKVSYPSLSTRMINRARDAILQEQADKNGEAQQTAQQRIAILEKQAGEDVDAVPKYIYVGYLRLPNPDYASTVKRINKEANGKIELVNAWLSNTRLRLQQFYESKMDGLAKAVEGTQSQRKEGITSLQLAPGTAQLYIKNYLHFELVPMPRFPDSALPAAEKKLKEASKSQIQS